MVNCILIADSGSTKTDWILTTAENSILEVETLGINPVRDSRDAIFDVIKNLLAPQLPKEYKVDQIFFYGAGCIDPYRKNVAEVLTSVFGSDAEIAVESDLLGAARALCGNQAGIACILGTGSNSCLYDGKEIVCNTSPLGFILGDEGSGAFLGKTLVGNILKKIFSQKLQDSFFEKFNLTPSIIINKVYREPMPNRFLASLVPFLEEHRENPEIHDMLIWAFRQFFIRNVKAYGHPEMDINCVGSIAFIYKKEIMDAAAIEGLKMGKILQKPVQNIVDFHRKTLFFGQKC
ncbi:MAG: ATPase [Bacteroidaceae bacterium]|nr:ATPase [Bacteroidaceae bacterium]